MQFLKIKLTVSNVFFAFIIIIIIGTASCFCSSLSPSTSRAFAKFFFFSEASPSLTVSSLSSRNWEPFPVYYCRLYINFYSFFVVFVVIRMFGFRLIPPPYNFANATRQLSCLSFLSFMRIGVPYCRYTVTAAAATIVALHYATASHIFRHIYLITKCSDTANAVICESNAIIASFLFIYKKNGV